METEEEKVSRLNAAHEVSKDFMQLKKKMKKYFCIFIIALLILSIIKIIFGTIEIYNPFGYPSSRNPSFETKVNGKRCGTSGHLYHHIPIIPFFLDFVSFSFVNNDFEKEQLIEYAYNGIGDVNISIKAFTCHYQGSKSQTECDYNKNRIVYEEKEDISYTKLVIFKNQKYWDPIYEGPFITDITDYVQDDGFYMITIYAKYSLTEVKSFFYIETKHE